MTVGHIIRTARDKLGWTRVELSQKVGVDRSAISRIETGERLPGVAVADSLERVLRLRKGTLTNAVLAEKMRKRERIRQLRRLIYESALTVEEIRRRLGKDRSEQNQ